MNPNLSLGSETDVGSSNLLASGRRPYSGDTHHRRSSDVSEHRMSMYGSNGLDGHEPPTSPVSPNDTNLSDDLVVHQYLNMALLSALMFLKARSRLYLTIPDLTSNFC